ncbi:UNVERIFIED_CONTAM: CASP-like protein 5C1 [Sesamum radiatum]|uniref:CASP-like protein 5C1 n=1 Tax=Sesamum radiatum TaxID=300843 RepID=A0AAW2U728_SESRA
MKNIPGSMGTCASIALRLGQAICSSVSILFMSLGVGFYSYTAFCDVFYFYMLISQLFGNNNGFSYPWSFTLALIDGYSILAKFPIHQSGMLQVIILGDLVIPTLGSTYKDMIIHDVTKFDVDRSYRFSHWRQRAQLQVLLIFCSKQMSHFVLQESVVDIRFQPPWPSCHGFFP